MDEKKIAHFWSKVDRRGPHECWPWLAGRSDRGYGWFNINRRLIKAHRVAFFIANGRWPEPFGLHRCDNPPCVNPAHIFEGTHETNAEDKVRKGRLVLTYGEASHLAKLTEKDVLAIRASSESHRTLAARYGVSATHIHKIQRRLKWAHLQAPPSNSRDLDLSSNSSPALERDSPLSK